MTEPSDLVKIENRSWSTADPCRTPVVSGQGTEVDPFLFRSDPAAPSGGWISARLHHV